jgi:SAM-dependent methyltransferase
VSVSDDATRNRAHWDDTSAAYQEQHGEFIGGDEPAWGEWQIPERKLQVLGDVAGKDVLELGCGAAQWAIHLARAGARMVALDNSEKQLQHARRLMGEAGVDFPLVHASAEAVPLSDATFDVVFCDHGAMTFADPFRTVPEAARLLRSGGLFAFSMLSAFAWVCWDEGADEVRPQLAGAYFGMHREETLDGAVQFNLPYGEWIRLFRRSGLIVEDLVEPQPGPEARTTYGFPLDWARQWPSEAIWKARKP